VVYLFASDKNVSSKIPVVWLLCSKVGRRRGQKYLVRALETFQGVIPVLACLKESPGSAAGDLIVSYFYFCDRKRFLEEEDTQDTRRKGRAVELGQARRKYGLDIGYEAGAERTHYILGDFVPYMQMFGTNGTGMCLAADEIGLLCTSY
jgi:hypothetical protein